MIDPCVSLSKEKVTVLKAALADDEYIKLYCDPRYGMRGQFAAFAALPKDTRQAICDAIDLYRLGQSKACFHIYRTKNGIQYVWDYVLLEDEYGVWWGVTKNTHELGERIRLQASIRQRRSWSPLAEIRKLTFKYLFTGVVAFLLGIAGVWFESRNSFEDILGPAVFAVIGGLILLDIFVFSYFRHQSEFRKVSIAMLNRDVFTPEKKAAAERDGSVSMS